MLKKISIEINFDLGVAFPFFRRMAKPTSTKVKLNILFGLADFKTLFNEFIKKHKWEPIEDFELKQEIFTSL